MIKKAFIILALGIMACTPPVNPLKGLKRGLWMSDRSDYKVRKKEDSTSSMFTSYVPAFVLSDTADELVYDYASYPLILRPFYMQNNTWNLGYNMLVERNKEQFIITYRLPNEPTEKVNYYHFLTKTKYSLNIEDLVSTEWRLQPPIYDIEEVWFPNLALGPDKEKYLRAIFVPVGLDSIQYESLFEYDDSPFSAFMAKHSQVTFISFDVFAIRGTYVLVDGNKDTLHTIVTSPPYVGQKCMWTRIKMKEEVL